MFITCNIQLLLQWKASNCNYNGNCNANRVLVTALIAVMVTKQRWNPGVSYCSFVVNPGSKRNTWLGYARFLFIEIHVWLFKHENGHDLSKMNKLDGFGIYFKLDHVQLEVLLHMSSQCQSFTSRPRHEDSWTDGRSVRMVWSQPKEILATSTSASNVCHPSPHPWRYFEASALTEWYTSILN